MLDLGDEKTCTITMSDQLQAGVIYELSLRSSEGNIYPVTITAFMGSGRGTPEITEVSCLSVTITTTITKS